MNEPLWKLWRNPIVRRFATARLRWTRLLAWSVVLQALGAFLWLSFYYFFKRQQMPVADCALRAWVPILFLQGVLWLMKGTFSVATGIAREGIEGLTEAQILTPLSSWHKTVGYLIGLPILETVLVLSLLPWTVVSIIAGQIPAGMVVRIHLLLLTAALVHHALGLVAGTVIRQKIVAGTVSQIFVILLHGVMPLLSWMGLAPLGRLGVWGAISSELAPLLQNATRNVVSPEAIYAFSHVRFFRWEFALTGYQWCVMSLLLCVLLTILWRRWQRSTAHLFSKPLAVVFFSGVLLLSLGEIVPRLQGPTFFPADTIPHNASGMKMSVHSQTSVAMFWAGGFGIVGLLTAMLLSASIAPKLEQHWRALRGVARSTGARLSWADDARSAIPWVVLLAAALIAGWHYLVRQLLDAPFLGHLVTADPSMPYLFAAGILIPLLYWSILVEWRGLRFASMEVFVVWIVPPMIAVVSVLSGVSPLDWPRWFLGASGFALPLLALLESFNGPFKISVDFSRLHTVWVTSVAAHAVVVAVFYACLRRAQKSGTKTVAVPSPAKILVPETPLVDTVAT